MSFADQVQRCPQVQYRLIPVLDNNIRDDIIELDDEAAKSIFLACTYSCPSGNTLQLTPTESFGGSKYHAECVSIDCLGFDSHFTCLFTYTRIKLGSKEWFRFEEIGQRVKVDVDAYCTVPSNFFQ